MIEEAMIEEKTVSIRAGTAADAEAIARLHIDSWRATYRDDLPADYLAGLDPTRHADRWREVISLPRVAILVAEHHRRLIGFAAFGPPRDADLDGAVVCQLYNLHVAADRWSTGVGTSIWRHVWEAARQQGYREVALWVLPTNTRARRFYQRLGLEPDGARRWETLAPAVGFDEIRYRASLARSGPIATG